MALSSGRGPLWRRRLGGHGPGGHSLLAAGREPAQALLEVAGHLGRRTCPLFCLRIPLKTVGEPPAPGQPLVVVANHESILDSFALVGTATFGVEGGSRDSSSGQGRDRGVARGRGALSSKRARISRRAAGPPDRRLTQCLDDLPEAVEVNRPAVTQRLNVHVVGAGVKVSLDVLGHCSGVSPCHQSVDQPVAATAGQFIFFEAQAPEVREIIRQG